MLHASEDAVGCVQTASSDSRKEPLRKQAGHTDSAQGPPAKKFKEIHNMTSDGEKKLAAYGLENMYTFTRAKNGACSSHAIDLTSSPPAAKVTPATPIRKIIARQLNAEVETTLSHHLTKRLVVKNFRITPKTSPEDFLMKTWIKLEATLNNILIDGSEIIFMEEMYRAVENICKQGKAEALYQKLIHVCENHMSTVRESLQSEASNMADSLVLDIMCTAWLKWQKQMVSLESSQHQHQHQLTI